MLMHVCNNILPALMHMPRFVSFTRAPVATFTHACLCSLRVQVFAAAMLQHRSSMLYRSLQCCTARVNMRTQPP
eukprot:1979146-Pleurochrysis_carterae.AAC.3